MSDYIESEWRVTCVTVRAVLTRVIVEDAPLPKVHVGEVSGHIVFVRRCVFVHVFRRVGARVHESVHNLCGLVVADTGASEVRHSTIIVYGLGVSQVGVTHVTLPAHLTPAGVKYSIPA